MKYKLWKRLLPLLLACVLPLGCAQTRQANAPGEREERSIVLWMHLNKSNFNDIQNFGDTYFAKEIQKRTGIKVEYRHPEAEQLDKEISLLLASGDPPDIISVADVNSFVNGVEENIESGYIASLNNLIDQYSPNFKAYLSRHPEVERRIRTSKGDYYNYPFLRETERQDIFKGPMVRGDWLKKLGADLPETIDDWESMLRAFQELPGVEAPMMTDYSGLYDAFAGAFGIKVDFYVDDGEVKFGYYEPAYLDFLVLMKRWYNEGLINKNISGVDDNLMAEYMVNGKSGATVAGAGAGMGRWMQAAAKPGFSLDATTYPVLEKGTRPKFGIAYVTHPIVGSMIVSGKSENKDLCAKYLDFGYGEEGHMLYNFGIEGESYVMEDGYPRYTDKIMNNPEGLSVTNAMMQYMLAGYNGPFVQDKRYLEQYYALPQQKQALERWERTDNSEHAIYYSMFSGKDGSEMERLMGYIWPYVNDMFYRFVTGVEPLENFEAYREQLRMYQIDRVLELKKKSIHDN